MSDVTQHEIKMNDHSPVMALTGPIPHTMFSHGTQRASAACLHLGAVSHVNFAEFGRSINSQTRRGLLLRWSHLFSE